MNVVEMPGGADFRVVYSWRESGSSAATVRGGVYSIALARIRGARDRLVAEATPRYEAAD